MMGSMGTRRLISRLVSRQRFPPPPRPFRALSAGATTLPPPPPAPSGDPPPRSGEAPPQDDGAKPHRRTTGGRARRGVAGDYEEEQTLVLRAALPHVVRLGWSESAMIAGARDVGVSPSIVGTFPRKEAALVEVINFFMDYCLERLVGRIDSEEGDKLKDLILSDRLSKLIRMRLEMQVPYASKWPQALSIQRGVLVDEIWHAAGDAGLDIDWYVKRTVLGGIYSTSEVYMVTDNSPELGDTWTFVDRRIKDALDLEKTVQEAANLAEAVGAGVGSSMQGFLKRAFQG
ncbi:Ubiquinone biosynthesis protein COQ9, mitochondrial [Ananas comosus]|uniref:Ubiquinone biosynthesis protein n=1 Tax=Ananas comosus TaxID=4615 RepID=A0A199VH55_ANACO|nr:Ubiquinone biosynthesis protein COQ9, mitochondrial [Ananas comosus]